MSQIPKRIRDRLQILSDKSGYTIEDLEERILELADTGEGLGIQTAYQRVRGELRRESGNLRSPAITYTGVFIGDSGTVDFIDLMKKRALRMWETQREEAIDKNFVNREGTPLDRREKVNFEENPNLYQPFRPEDKSLHRELYGIASKGKVFDWAEADFFRLAFNDEKVEELEEAGIPFYSWLTFRANKRKTKEPFFDLNYSKSLEVDFKVQRDLVPDDLEDLEMVLRNSHWQPITLNEVETFYSLHSDKRAPPPAILEAYVSDIADDISEKTGDRSIVLDDDDYWDESGLFGFLPGDFPIIFGLDSRLFLVGSVETFRGDEEEDEPRFLFRARGYLPMKDYLVPL